MRFQGTKQRVMIMAIACKPQLLIADEPTTFRCNRSKEIIQLLKDIQQETGMSIISHDLSLVSACPSGFSDVPGEIVEQGK
jgi:peptide/nickel transport system ATP-binding protein